MTPLYRLLHVEDSPDDAELVVIALSKAAFKYELVRVETEAEYTAELEARVPDVIICDYNLPQFSAERALEMLRQRGLDVPFIVVSHHIGHNEAVIAMQNGASDYLPKRDLGRLCKAIESAIDRRNTRRESLRIQEALRESESIRRGILNSLHSGIVMVDGGGFIVAVNKAWTSTVSARGPSEPALSLEGANYFDMLHAAEERGDASAAELAAGLHSVIEREKTLFSIEYQLRTGSGTRWFVARVMPLEGSERAAVISHRDVTDRMMVHIALEDANKRLQTISKRLLGVQEEERRAISLELHDDIGQTLGALKIGLLRLTTATPDDQPPLLAGCLDAAEDALEKLRALAMELRPPQLDQLGLKEALEWLAQRQSTISGVEVTCAFAGLDSRPAAAFESACYRIAQEALNNATRHGKATHVRISVESDGALLKLVVRDDGVGFDEDAARVRVARSGSLGLIGMEERAQLAGGRLKLRSVPGSGTTVSAVFPLVQRNYGNAGQREPAMSP